MAAWQTLLSSIRKVQTELVWLRPNRSLTLRMNPGASQYSIWSAESRLGQPLPPSYRSFLAESDGLPHFYEGASLLGTDRLGQHRYQVLLGSVCDREETPAPGVSPRSRRTPGSRLIPFGADPEGSTVFAFDTSRRRRDGEYTVISWINDIGLVSADFEDFLRVILDLYEDELESQLVASSAA